MAWDVLSGVTKTAWDVLSGVANRCRMFCPGCQKMAWDVLSRDVLSYILFAPVLFATLSACVIRNMSKTGFLASRPKYKLSPYVIEMSKM